MLSSFAVSAQSVAEQLADKIARKMKDSLLLTDQHKNQLYTLNMQLHQQKQIAFARYRGSDSLRIHLQRIENSRDSLYSTVLPPEKFQLYKQKKRALVTND